VASSPISFTVASVQTYTISGHVMAGGCPLFNVTINMTGVGSTTTDASGAYSFTVAASGTYTPTPSKANYTFSPNPPTFNGLTSNVTADFAATGPAIPSREYIRLGGRVIAIANCGSQ
jgi:hypothetical protein